MSYCKKIRSQLYRHAYIKLIKLCIPIFYYLPIKKNRIVFIKGNGDGYACNLRPIAEEIIKQQLKYDMVWLLLVKDENMPTQIRKVRFNRIRAVYELSTAHVIITNSKSYISFKKKKFQKLIYIPHGQPGCKCAEGDGNLTPQYLKMSKFHSSITDVFVSMGTYHTQVLKDTFWVPKTAEIWECGFPRNDRYYHNTEALQKQIRQRIHISQDYHIALYAPTFRDNGKTDAYNLDLHRLLKTLEKKTGEKWILFITLHPCFRWFKHPPYTFDSHIWDMSSYTDIHELLLIVDITISDYSSVALDFANTRKPVFLYASDIDEYTRMRGLKDMYYKLPFPLCKNNDELEAAITNFDINKYNQRLKDFNNIYGSFDDGHASERFIERLKTIIK